MLDPSDGLPRADEARRRERQGALRAEERFRTLEKVAAGIGHDLRNQLSVIETSVFLLRQRLAEQVATDSKVPVEIQGSIFEPLFTTKAKGGGLGLPLARRIVDTFPSIRQKLRCTHGQ